MAIRAPFLRRISSPPGDSDEYPFSVPILKDGLELEFDRPVTFLCGDNGSGKSTVLEALAMHCGFSVYGGNRDHRVGEQDVDVTPLAQAMKASWSLKVTSGFFMRAESVFQFGNWLDAVGNQNRSLNEQSHGEAFLALVQNRFGRQGLYILDEPEAALSPQRQLTLLALLQDLERSGRAQFIIATHSPLLMAYPGSTFYWIDDDGITEKNYKATVHFQVLKRFFADPDDYVAKFLAD